LRLLVLRSFPRYSINMVLVNVEKHRFDHLYGIYRLVRSVEKKILR